MRFTLYTDKSIAQCIQALNERVQGAGKTQGRVDKANSRFSFSTSTKVLRRFSRSTRLSATLSREDGLTVIQGYVSEGMERSRWFLILILVIALTVIFYVVGNAMLMILTVLVGLWSYIPLTGDAQNSDTLLRDVKRTLNAKDTKPKPESPTSSAAKPTVSQRPSANPSPFGASRSAPPPPSRPSSTSNPTSKYNPPPRK